MRWLAAGFVFVLLLSWQGTAPFASWNAVRRMAPKLEGTIRLSELGSETSIRRDARGVPHIASSKNVDSWFALGFAHAQDRLGQMLWMRRLARGTSAEIASCLRGAQGPAQTPRRIPRIQGRPGGCAEARRGT